MPSLFGLGALVAAVVTVVIDAHVDLQVREHDFLVRDASTALTLTSVVATAMLAFLGIVFATTLVAIQLAASQYSPRAVRVFVRSRLTKFSLGIFVATFMFSIVTLVAIRSANRAGGRFTPTLSTAGVVLLVIATLIAFLLFANGTARLLRVQYLVERIATDCRNDLHAAFPTVEEHTPADRPEPSPGSIELATRTEGVLDAVDVGDLTTLAADHGGWIDLRAPIGSYVGFGSTVAILHFAPSSGGADARDLAARIDRCLLFSNERTTLQDPGFGFRQLVDIAIRALSPAVNDPTTAVQVIDRLVDLLARIVERPDPSGWYVDDAGVVRVRTPVDTYDELVTLAFTEIIRYGADSPQVVRRLRAAFEQLSDTAGANASSVRMQQLLDAATGDLAVPAFRALGEVADRRGLG